MIISHKYKFIFIKTRKTAGTSIEVYLSQYCGIEDVLTPIFPYVEPHAPRNYRGIWNPIREIKSNHGKNSLWTLKQLIKRRKYYNHIPARILKSRIPKYIWNNYYKFTFERNPWDKALSNYFGYINRTGYNISFDNFLNKGKLSCYNFPLYFDDQNNHLMVDEILYYEDIENELSRVFNFLGIPFNGSLNVYAKSEYRVDRKNYREVFTNNQKKIIDDLFYKEINFHKYDF
jgi:hypothetical protein